MAINAPDLRNPDEIGKPITDESWTERESEANEDTPPEYPYNKVFESKSGHSLEFDDTRGRERIRLQHSGVNRGGLGSFVEYHSNGDTTTKVIGDGYEIILGKKRVYVKGVCNITIEGDSIVNVKGDKYERIEGNFYQEIRGEYSQYVGKTSKILSGGNMQIGAAANDTIKGKMTLQAGNHVYVQSDQIVDGSLTGTIINSETKVHAKNQVVSGPGGFVTATGGLALGSTVAIPLNAIMPAGGLWAGTTVNAGVSVNSPLINGGIVRDAVSTMMTMRGIFNIHNHLGVHGMTSTPFELML